MKCPYLEAKALEFYAAVMARTQRETPAENAEHQHKISTAESQDVHGWRLIETAPHDRVIWAFGWYRAEGESERHPFQMAIRWTRIIWDQWGWEPAEPSDTGGYEVAFTRWRPLAPEPALER